MKKIFKVFLVLFVLASIVSVMGSGNSTSKNNESQKKEVIPTGLTPEEVKSSLELFSQVGISKFEYYKNAVTVAHMDRDIWDSINYDGKKQLISSIGVFSQKMTRRKSPFSFEVIDSYSGEKLGSYSVFSGITIGSN